MAEFDPISYSKANKVAAQMAEKANQADLTALETRLDSQMAEKANQADLTALETRLDSQMAEKANQADLTALETRVDTIITTPVDGVSAQEIIDARQGAATLGANIEAFKNDYTTYKDSNNLKIAKIEKDLNDYQQAMSSINPNQEATQKATGYGIVSLPKNAANGQVSDVAIKGLTATNLVKNGNFANGITGWVQSGATLSAVNNILSIAGSGASAFVRAYHEILPTAPTVGKKYFVRAKVTAKYSGGKTMRLKLSDGLDNYSYTVAAKNSPVENTQYILSGIIEITTQTRLRVYLQSEFSNAATANGKVMEVQEVLAIDMGTDSSNPLYNLTADQINAMFPNWFDGTKSTISAIRLTSKNEDETEQSTQYITAKDEQGNIAELRSLPNGTKDEIRVSEGKLIKRVSDEYKDFSTIWCYDSVYEVFELTKSNLPNITNNYSVGIGVFYNQDGFSDVNRLYTPGGIQKMAFNLPANLLTSKGYTADSVGARQWAIDTELTLIYQLAEPVEIPIEVSGNIVSYPSGTVYIEPFVADAGIYTGKMSVLHQDLPIKAIEKISKVDFITGLETELDVSDAVIAEDKLSFTHRNLEAGDIVFFTYEYDRESTEGETEIEYYDSRYVIKDSVTEKFYKWHIAVAGGVPSIELVEV